MWMEGAWVLHAFLALPISPLQGHPVLLPCDTIDMVFNLVKTLSQVFLLTAQTVLHTILTWLAGLCVSARP